MKKKGIGQLVNYCNHNLGLEVTVRMLDRIKSLGFNYATISGLSVGLDDMAIADVINGAAFFNWSNRLMLSLGEPEIPA